MEWTLLSSWREEIAAGCWAEVPALAGFAYVISGDGEALMTTGRVELHAGDFLLLTDARPHLHARTELTLLVSVLEPVQRAETHPLPEWLSVQRFDRHDPAMATLLEQMGCHSLDPHQRRAFSRAGDSVVCSRIAMAIVSSAIRLWSELGCAPERWLRRVSDPGLGQLLDALHDDPAQSWSVERMARVSALSRSVFAERFHAALGVTPVAYLTSVRMDAAMALLDADRTVAEVARRVGYGSAVGFSRAFGRHTGMSPATWRTRRTLQSAS